MVTTRARLDGRLRVGRAARAEPPATVAPSASRLQAAGNRALASRLAVQRLVVLPGGVDDEARRVYDGDSPLLNHIDWALHQSGGPLVGFTGGPWPGLAPPADTVHVVEHGFPGGIVAGAARQGGKVQWYEPDPVTGQADLKLRVVREDLAAQKSWVMDDGHEREATGVVVDPVEWSPQQLAQELDAHLPAAFAGRIRITSCNSAEDRPNMPNTSLAEVVAAELRARNRPAGIQVSGVTGPSITSGATFAVTRPDREAEASVIQDQVRAQNAGALGQFYAWLDANPQATLEQRAERARVLFEPSFADLAARLGAQGLLRAAGGLERSFAT